LKIQLRISAVTYITLLFSHSLFKEQDHFLRMSYSAETHFNNVQNNNAANHWPTQSIDSSASLH
jgi:hypothetical protein